MLSSSQELKLIVTEQLDKQKKQINESKIREKKVSQNRVKELAER